MDFLVELILELLFEVPIDLAMGSRRLKKSVKTVIFCVLGGGLTALFGAIAVLTRMDGDGKGAFFISLVTLVMLFGTVFGAIRGHKNNWKNY